MDITSTHLGKYQGVRLLDCMVSIFGIVRSYVTVFPSGCAMLHPRKQRVSIPAAPHPRPHVVLLVLCMLVLPIGV